MRKALIISVGTGPAAQEEPTDSLASSISKSIKLANADKTYFIVTNESQQIMLPKILEKTALQSQNYETIHIKNPDDIQQTYQDLKEKFRQIKQDFDHIVIDYTSGTKAMTGALIAQGILHEVDWFCYMSGKREKGQGIPIRGTEKLVCLQPFFVTAEHKINTAIQLFNTHQFDACLTILNNIRKQTSDPDIIKWFASLEKAAKAYSLWDRFQHEEANTELSKLKEDVADKNKRFLHMLCKMEEKEPYYIADLINNAKRRGTEEKKFDDAVARLYRIIELLAQYQLRKKYNINTNEVHPKDLPNALLLKWHITPDIDKPLKIPMDKAYALLQAKSDPLGDKYYKDNELRDLLNKRNESILAHSQEPVTETIYTRLLQKTLDYASLTVDKLETALDDSTFPQWKK